MHTSNAKLEEHCFNISRDRYYILYLVFYLFSCKPYNVFTVLICIILKIWHSSVSLKGFQISSNNRQQVQYHCCICRMGKPSYEMVQTLLLIYNRLDGNFFADMLEKSTSYWMRQAKPVRKNMIVLSLQCLSRLSTLSFAGLIP